MIVTESRSPSLSAYLSSIRLHPRPSPTTSPLPRLNAQIRSQISVPHLTRPSHHSTARLQTSLPRFHPFPILLTPSSSIFPRWSPPRSHSPRRSLPSSLPVVVPFSSSSIHQNCNIYLNCPYSPMHASAELTSKRSSISQHTPHDWPLVSRTFGQYKIFMQKRTPPSGRYWDSYSSLFRAPGKLRHSSALSASCGGCAFFWNANSPSRS